MPTTRRPWNSRRPHFVVCGDDPLAQRLVDELRLQVGADVTVIMPSKRRNHGPQIARLPNVTVVEAGELSTETFQAARLDTARALALVGQDDVANIHAAMRAQEIRPDLRLVLRMFDMGLGDRIRTMFTDCAVLSDSALAAPWLVADALEQLTPGHVRLPGRTLRIARRGDVPDDRVVCGLADTSDPYRMRLLPEDEDGADLVLATADASLKDPLSGERLWPARLRRPALWLRAFATRRLIAFVLAFVAVLIAVSAVFAVIGDYAWPDAIYLALLDAAGAAQPELGRSAGEKIIQIVVTVLGISLIPVLTAAVVDTVVGGRLAAAAGRLRWPVRDHHVVVGLGNVGSRVLEQLHDLGQQVVCVEVNQDAKGVPLARRLGVPVVFGDANEPETLRAASVGTGRAVLALTSDDVTNLRVALSARELRGDLRLVLRLFDGDFAARVQRSFDIATSRSVSFLSAPSFVTAMVERQVIDTIAVGRRVLLIAEVRLGAESELAGQQIAHAEALREVRILGVRAGADGIVDWQPHSGRTLVAEERLLLIATRAGLGRALTASIGSVAVTES